MPRMPVKLNRNREGFNAAHRKWHAHPTALVEGDSWFQYDAVIPANPSSSNLFLGTHQYFSCVALLIAHVGDTVKEMLGPYVALDAPGLPIEISSKGDKNLRSIRGYLNRQDPFSVFFFSGGGNDIVDNLAGLIRKHEAGISAADALIAENVAAQMSALRQGYLRLIAARDAASPSTWILTHQYGVPNLRKGPFRRLGHRWSGEWIKPAFRKQEYLKRGEPMSPEQLTLMTDVIRLLMVAFSSMLAEVQRSPGVRGFFVAPTSAVLQPEHWRDEMHLTQEGFRLAASTLRPHLEQFFPEWTA